jgi:hypothetical protein
VAVVSGRRSINLGFELHVEIRWIFSISLLSYFLFFQRQNVFQKLSNLKSLRLYAIIFIFFYLYLIVNSIIISRKNEIAFLLFSDLVYFIFLGILVFLLLDTKNKLIYFWSNFAAIGLLLSIGALIFDKTESNGPGKIFLASSFTFARILTISVLACLVLIKVLRGKRIVVYLRFLYAFLLYSVLNTFNFASILSLSIVIFFHIIYFVTIKNKKEVTNLFILSVVPIVLFFTMNGKVLDAKFNNNLSLSTSDQVISSVLNNKESNKLLLDKEVVSKYLSDNKLVLLFDRSDRLSMWLVALKNFGDNPVFGLGFGSYIHIGFQLDYLEGGPIYSYPHNPFLELASQAGLIGLIIFSILVAYSFILIFRTYRLSSVSIDFVFVLCFFFLVSQFGGDLYDFRYFWIMSLIGVLTSHLYERNSK